tara:strand:+ start:289 stop:921 length:633 start_codon:yes stop_codon:yes gene_type:complete
MPCSHLFRVVLAGESGAGKSWFIKRFIDREMPQRRPGTVGVDFATAVVAHRSAGIRLHFWDTAGQMSYRKIVRAYFRAADGILLFFDVTERESFTRLPGWLAELDVASTGKVRPPVVIVGSKIDEKEKREVSLSEATTYAMREGCMYEEVSAATGYNIGTPVMRVTESVYNQIDGLVSYSDSGASNAQTSCLLAGQAKGRNSRRSFCRLC